MRDTDVFDYHLRGAGWARATFRLDGVEPVIVAVSYMHDSLRELSRALIALDTSPREVGVCFIEEPGTAWLVMRRPDDEHVQVELLRFRDWVVRWPPRSDDPPERLGAARLRWWTFRGALLSVLQRLWREHGAAGYVELWLAHPFPIDELRALEARCPGP
jgi:hypothetical protein